MEINQNQQEQINEISVELDSKQEQERKRVQQMENLQQQLHAIRRELSELDVTQEEKIKEEILRVHQEITQETKILAGITEEKENLGFEINSLHNSRREYQQDLDRLQDLSGHRMRELRKANSHVYEATMWLRKNTHLFSKKIYEPMVLLINMKDPSDAMYVEAQIPQRDLYAFTCEDKQDMNAFLAKMRDELRLKVSVLHSGENYNKPYPPNIPLPKLSQYGFKKYLIDAFTASSN